MQWCGRDYPHESSAKSSSRKLKLGTNGWRECRVWISQDLLDFCVARSFRTAAALNTGTQERGTVCGALLVDQLGFTSCCCRCCLYAMVMTQWKGIDVCFLVHFGEVSTNVKQKISAPVWLEHYHWLFFFSLSCHVQLGALSSQAGAQSFHLMFWGEVVQMEIHPPIRNQIKHWVGLLSMLPSLTLVLSLYRS